MLAMVAMITRAAAANAQPEVVQEQGFVASCTGQGDGYTAMVDLNQNSAYGVAAGLNIAYATGTELVGTGTTSGPILTNNKVNVDFTLVNPDSQPPSPARSATVSGSCDLAGQPRRVHEVRRDAGYIVVVTGTNAHSPPT
jgi:hypothetical protein